MPPCWSRRPAPARPRACRWCWRDEPWATGKQDHRARAAPARRARRRRAHGGDARRGGRRDRRLPRALRLQSVARDPHRGRHRGRVHPHDARRSRARRRRGAAVRRVPRALARRRSRPRAGARRAAGPARGPQAPGHVGDARRRARREAPRRRAGDRERGPRLPGRDPLSRARSARADRAAGRRRRAARRCAPSRARCWRSCRAPREIRRTETLLRERIADPAVDIVAALRRARRRRAGPRHRAGAARPAQGRAGDLDRRDLAHHRGRAHRGRLRARARAALRARRRADAARDRAGLARLRRPAPRPRRPHRARRLLPAVGRAADRLARARQHAGNPRRRSVAASCSISRTGASPIRRRSPSSIRRRRAALDRGEGAAARARRDRCATAASPTEGRRLRATAAAAAARAHGGRRGGARARRSSRPRSRVVLTERGLGGNDVDLAHRLDALRRDRSRRAAGRARDGEALGGHGRSANRSVADERARSARANAVLERRRAARARLSRPHRQEPRRGRRVPARQRPRRQRRSGVARWRASPISRSPRSPARAAQGRILLAAPIDARRDRGAFRRPHRGARRDRLRRREREPARAPQLRRLGAIALAEQPMQVEPNDETARMLAEGIARLGIDRLPWTQVAAAMARPGHVPAPGRRRRMARPLRCRARRDARRIGSRRRSPARPRSPSFGADELADALHGLLPWNLRRRLDAEAPTHFAAPSGSSVPIDYEAEEGPKLVDPRAGTVRPRPPSGRSPAGACRWWSNCCRRRTGRCR